MLLDLEKPNATFATTSHPMKATIDFSLPEETYEHLQAIHAHEAWAALSNLDYKLRSIIKHGHNYKSVEELAHEIREEISQTLSMVDV